MGNLRFDSLMLLSDWDAQIRAGRYGKKKRSHFYFYIIWYGYFSQFLCSFSTTSFKAGVLKTKETKDQLDYLSIHKVKNKAKHIRSTQKNRCIEEKCLCIPPVEKCETHTHTQHISPPWLLINMLPADHCTQAEIYQDHKSQSYYAQPLLKHPPGCKL